MRLRELVLGSADGNCQIVLHAGASEGDRKPLRRSVASTPTLRAELAAVFGGPNVWEGDA